MMTSPRCDVLFFSVGACILLLEYRKLKLGVHIHLTFDMITVLNIVTLD